MQGQLRGKKLSAIIETTCAHCNRPMQLKADSDLNVDIVEGGSGPVLTTPLLNLSKLDDPSIIDAF